MACQSMPPKVGSKYMSLTICQTVSKMDRRPSAVNPGSAVTVGVEVGVGAVAFPQPLSTRLSAISSGRVQIRLILAAGYRVLANTRLLFL